MFEGLVAHVLTSYLGQYVKDLNCQKLQFGIWNGEMVLENLELNTEMFDSPELNIAVHAGFLGSCRIKIPWNTFGKDHVVVTLDRLYILAGPYPYEARTFDAELQVSRLRPRGVFRARFNGRCFFCAAQRRRDRLAKQAEITAAQMIDQGTMA